MNTNPGKPRLEWLDGLRGLCAVYVALYHVEQRQSGGFWSLFQSGHYAVAVFIVISGFCLYIPLAKRDGTLASRGGTWEFYKSRARRILPAYYAALAGSTLLLLAAHHDVPHARFMRSVWLHIPLLSNLWIQEFPVDPYDGPDPPLWSVELEWWVYVAFPFYVLAFRRWGFLKGAAAALALGYAYVFLSAGTTWVTVCPYYAGLFALGMGAAAVAYGQEAQSAAWRTRLLRMGPLRPFWLTTIVLAGTATMLGASGVYRYEMWADGAIGVAAALLMCGISLRSGSVIERFLSFRLVAGIGLGSYSLYLVHYPIIAVFFGHLPNWQLLFVIGGVAGVFYLLVERPSALLASNSRHERPGLLHGDGTKHLPIKEKV